MTGHATTDMALHYFHENERVPVFCEWEMAEHWLEECVADDYGGGMPGFRQDLI